MGFDVYDVSVYDPERVVELMNEDDRVELSLSPGELRQSLMDRFRQEVSEGEFHFVNIFLETHGVQRSDEERAEDEECQRSLLLDVEEILYDSEDEDFLSSFWEFSSARLVVREEL